MTLGKAARVAARHGLGRPVRTYRQAFPLWWTLLWIGIPVLIIIPLLVNQGLGIVPKVIGAAVPLLATAILCWALSDVRLVLCERGLLIGRFFPGMAPYPIPYPQIEPRGVTCVSDIGRFSKATSREFGSTLFYLPQSRRGIILDGPMPKAVRVHTWSPASAFDTKPDTVRGGKLWAFAYQGAPEELVATLQRGMAATGSPHAAALPGAALPERSIAAAPGDGPSAINGLAR